MRHIYKVVVSIGVILVLVGLLTSCSVLFPDLELGIKKTELSGRIEILTDQLKVGQQIPMVLVISDELDALEKELWSVESAEADYILIEADNFDDDYNLTEIEAIFNEVDVPIMIEDQYGEPIYNPKLMIFIPEGVDEYHIEVDGYYKSSSPRFVTDIDIIINE